MATSRWLGLVLLTGCAPGVYDGAPTDALWGAEAPERPARPGDDLAEAARGVLQLQTPTWGGTGQLARGPDGALWAPADGALCRVHLGGAEPDEFPETLPPDGDLVEPPADAPADPPADGPGEAPADPPEDPPADGPSDPPAEGPGVAPAPGLYVVSADGVDAVLPAGDEVPTTAADGGWSRVPVVEGQGFVAAARGPLGLVTLRQAGKDRCQLTWHDLDYAARLGGQCAKVDVRGDTTWVLTTGPRGALYVAHAPGVGAEVPGTAGALAVAVHPEGDRVAVLTADTLAVRDALGDAAWVVEAPERLPSDVPALGWAEGEDAVVVAGDRVGASWMRAFDGATGEALGGLTLPGLRRPAQVVDLGDGAVFVRSGATYEAWVVSVRR